MSDILERLRSVGNGDTWSSHEVVALINQAADEIEALRKELKAGSVNPSLDWALNSGDGVYRP